MEYANSFGNITFCCKCLEFGEQEGAWPTFMD